MRFLVDAQLPPALAQWLRKAGHEAQAVREIGLRDADDTTIWNYARQNDCVIVTKDEDFARRTQVTTGKPDVVWLRIGNTSNAALRAWLVPQTPKIINLLQQGYRLIEVR